MDEFTLREEILKGQDSIQRFRRSVISTDALASEIVAFLNTRGGKIFIGVDKEGTISGLTPEQMLPMENLVSIACSQSVNPPCSVLTFNVSTSEGMVVVVEVPDGPDKPYQDKKKQFWVKKGADKRRVFERSELRRLFQGGHVTYADSSPVPGTGIDDLDMKALRDFYHTMYPAETLSEDEGELTRQLQGVRLMVGQQLGLAAVLLFAKKPSALLPEFTIKAVWFKGTDRSGTEYRDSRRFEGTLQSQYEQGMAFFRRWASRVQAGESFNDPAEAEIPDFVFEEILVNALVHRDYFIADSVKLFIFDDRIEVRSPGTLPNSLTEEEALKGQGRERNPKIEWLAYQLMNYRGVRSGLKRVKAAVPEVELHNDIEGEEVTVAIPFRRHSA